MKYKVGHYYKRTYKKTNHFITFKVTKVLEHTDFMFITMLRLGAVRKGYDCAFRISSSDSKTVELTEMELTTIML